jgi:hypothetical protein
MPYTSEDLIKNLQNNENENIAILMINNGVRLDRYELPDDLYIKYLRLLSLTFHIRVLYWRSVGCLLDVRSKGM